MNLKGKLSLSQWVKEHQDYELHSLGQYYQYLTGKFSNRKRDQAVTLGFSRWLVEKDDEITREIVQLVAEDEFEIIRDWIPILCFFRRKVR